MKLRDYQVDLTNQVFHCWSRGINRTLVQLPTGGGKTIIFVAIAKEFLVQSEPILVVAHRKELIFQAAQKMSAVTDEKIGLIKAGIKPNPDALVQVASIQTLARREYPPASLVIIDECHHANSPSYAKLIEHYTKQGAYILGFSATPARTDGKGLGQLAGGVKGFERLITGPSVQKLIDENYLAPVKIYSPKNIVDAGNSSVKTQMGDYSQKEVSKLVESTLIIGDVIQTWKKHANNKRTVLFAVSVAHSKKLAKAFRQAKIPAKHLDGSTPAKTRAKILKDFSKGKILVLCQHSIVTEGVDIPSIEAVQFIRPTKSLIFWFQAIGRAMRPLPNKDAAIVIDHTDTCLNLPWPTDEINWSLEDSKNQNKTQHKNVACPECGRAFTPAQNEVKRQITTCPSCSCIFGIKFAKKRSKVKRLEVTQVFKVIPTEFELINPKRTIASVYDEIGLSQQARAFINFSFLPYLKEVDYPYFFKYLKTLGSSEEILSTLKQLVVEAFTENTIVSGKISLERNGKKARCPKDEASDTTLENSSAIPTSIAKSDRAFTQFTEVNSTDKDESTADKPQIDKWQTVENLFKIQRQRNYAPGWIGYRLLDLPELNLSVEDLEIIGKELGYKSGWGYHHHRKIQDRDRVS